MTTPDGSGLETNVGSAIAHPTEIPLSRAVQVLGPVTMKLDFMQEENVNYAWLASKQKRALNENFLINKSSSTNATLLSLTKPWKVPV